MVKSLYMPFAITWLDLETVLLNEVSQSRRSILHDITYMQNPKNGTNELVLQNRKKTQM